MFNGVCEVFDRFIELFRKSVVEDDCLGNIPFSVMKELDFFFVKKERQGKKHSWFSKLSLQEDFFNGTKPQ